MKKETVSTAAALISIFLVLAMVAEYLGGIHNGKGLNTPFVKINIVAYAVLATFFAVLAIVKGKRFRSTRKLYEPEQVCILNADYFRIVMESASQWVTLPYNVKDSMPGYLKVHPFKRIKGYVMTGFKMDWPKKDQPKTGIDMFDMLNGAPVQVVFVTNEMHAKIQAMKSRACVVELTEYGTAKAKHFEYGTIPYCAHVASTFVKELSDKEMNKIQAIDAVVGGTD